MPKKYVYRKQMSGLLDYHGFREQTETFLNDIDGDISAANAKIGNLSSLTTTDKSNLVAAINEAAQSGGGGGEEQFQKVYETTLAEAAEEVTITAENTGGTYVDMVCYILFADSGGSRTVGCEAYADSDGSVYIGGVQLAIDAPACTMSIESKGGLLYSSAFGLTGSGNTPSYVSVSGYSCPALMNGGPYPMTGKSGIAMLQLFVSSESFSAGTTITVYARKPVITPAE